MHCTYELEADVVASAAPAMFEQVTLRHFPRIMFMCVHVYSIALRCRTEKLSHACAFNFSSFVMGLLLGAMNADYLTPPISTITPFHLTMDC